MILALDQFLDIYVLHNVKLSEGLLEDFEVIEVLVVKLCLPVDFGDGYFIGVENVKELAVGSSSAHLLNFGVVEFQEVVDPLQKFAPRHFDGIVGVAGDFVYHFSYLFEYVLNYVYINLSI